MVIIPYFAKYSFCDRMPPGRAEIALPNSC
jgi:hypothetical protein